MRNTDGTGKRKIYLHADVHSSRRNASGDPDSPESLSHHTNAHRYRDPTQPDADSWVGVDAAPSDSDTNACAPNADAGSSDCDAEYAGADEYTVRRHADPYAPLMTKEAAPATVIPSGPSPARLPNQGNRGRLHVLR
jgi:hypothetical protein